MKNKNILNVIKLGSACTIKNGFAFSSKLFNQNKEGLPLIRIRDIKRGYSETFYSGSYSADYIIERGEYIIGMDGEFNIGQWKSTPSLLNQRVCKLTFNEEKLLSRYAFYYIPKELKKIEDKTGYSTVKHISSKQIQAISIPLPSLSEQQRIVDILDESFAKIDTVKQNAERNLKNAKELFQSVLDFELRLKEGWEEKKLPQISDNLDSKRVPITKNKRTHGDYPYYGASGIVDYVSEYLFDEDLLLISEDGANLLARTYPIAFSVNGKIWVNNHAHVLRFSDINTQRFVEYYFSSIKIDNYVTGMAQPKLNQNSLNSIAIPVPPLPKQQEIVSKLDALSEKCKTLENNYLQTIKDCDELKKAILTKAFNGEL